MSGEEVSRLGFIVGGILSAAIHNVGLETVRCLFNGGDNNLCFYNERFSAQGCAKSIVVLQNVPNINYCLNNKSTEIICASCWLGAPYHV